MTKIQILLFYFERPKFILNALNSIKEQDYENWELHFIDDGSVGSPGRPIVESLFTPAELEKTVFYNTGDSVDVKLARGGSIFGKFANDAMYNSSADITIMLCDDDALFPGYLSNLNEYFLKNGNINYAYSHVCVFNPFVEEIRDVDTIRDWFLNAHTQPIFPTNKVDASQVAWRRKETTEANIEFPYPQTINLDASLYLKLYSNFGPCPFTGFVSQYKAVHRDQLGNKGAANSPAHFVVDEGE